ncbi:MAG: glycogen synthase GlgA [Armatimonadetes bacterium]|nr:glycogen synthase GlgA [Armatimonadota bacterium]
MTDTLRVLLCTSEAVPFAKTGGLADVSGALPRALAGQGCDVGLMMPAYRSVPRDDLEAVAAVRVPVGPQTHEGRILRGVMPGTTIPVYFVEHPAFFDRPGLYGEGGRDYPDNLERFAFFCRAAVEYIRQAPRRPEIIHCNDWQTALIPVYLTTTHRDLGPIGTLFTIHNLAYQGLFPAEQFGMLGLPPDLYGIDALEYWGQVSLLKGGLRFADLLTTVSERYAEEIQTEEFGCGLEGVLRHRRDRLIGILNGVDYGAWDPAHDPHIPARYSAEDVSAKARCKEHLQREQRLARDPRAPLIGMVTRLADQKGLDLVAAVIEDVMARGAQFVLLGTGDPKYHQLFTRLRGRYRRQMAVTLSFDDSLAHRIEAGADMFLMPSRYEPSGLNQLYSLRYGTVPIVRRTGGLADSITDCTSETLAAGTATGFVFTPYTPDALRQALERALSAFADPAMWRRLQQAGMRADFSWARSAARYVEAYRGAREMLSVSLGTPR